MSLDDEYQKNSNFVEDISIEDNSYYDNEDVELLEQIEHYNVDDFMQYHKTRAILENEWQDNFETILKPKIECLFDDFKEINKNGKLLYKAEEIHKDDLVHIVRFHLKKEHNTDIFKKYPKYTRSFLDFLDKQIK